MPENSCSMQDPFETHDMVRYPFMQKLRDRLNEILSEYFMKKYTNFESFEQFQYSSAVFVKWDAPVLIYSVDRLNGFVSESTKFKTWDEMLIKAVQVFEEGN